jgi:RNA polymerase sigma-70 factor, ECF subfamily
MTTLARTLLRDADEAADVVEQALLRIRDAAPRLRSAASLKAWALRIVANLCRDQLRRRKFVAGRPEDMDPLRSAGLHVDPGHDWDEALDRDRVLGALERAIAELPAEQREAVILRDRLGLSYEEAAEALGSSLASVKSRLFRARATLRQKLKPYLE